MAEYNDDYVPSFGGRTREVTTGEFIRDYLIEQGPDYVRSIHKSYQSFCHDNGEQGCTYSTFRNHMWKLKKIGLVHVVREEDMPGAMNMTKRFYDVRPEADLDHDGWTDAIGVLYGR